MSQLIFLVVALFQCNENTKIVRSRNHTDAGASELCTQLIESSSADALLRAIDIEGRDGWMVGCLFGEVRDLDKLVPCNTSSATGGCRAGTVLKRWLSIFNLPITLLVSVYEDAE